MQGSSVARAVSPRRFEGPALAALRAERRRKAVRIARRALKRAPGDPLVARSAAMILVLAGDEDGAIRVLEDALDRGAWWSRVLLVSCALSSLSGRRRFEAVVAEATRRQQEAPDGPGGLYVWRPAQPARAILLFLHGAAAKVPPVMDRWAPVAEREGLMLVMPQSTQPTGPGDYYGWDDVPRARAEIDAAVEHVRADRAARGRPLYVAGGSQGAGLAMELGLEGRRSLDAKGFVALTPWWQRPEAVPPLLAQAAEERCRGVLMSGDLDPLLFETRRQAAALAGAGVSCMFDVMPGVGHTNPPDFEDRMTRALRFVL